MSSAPTDGWPFPTPRDAATITTRFVLDGTRPILLVAHDEDGDWQAVCGTTDEDDHLRVILLAEAVALDASIGEVADLKAGWQAWRATVDAPWQRQPLVSAESDDEPRA